MIGKVYSNRPNPLSRRANIYKVTRMINEYDVRISIFDYENRKWKDLTTIDARTFEGWYTLHDPIGKRLVRR